jgi:hypothetical protein
MGRALRAAAVLALMPAIALLTVPAGLEAQEAAVSASAVTLSSRAATLELETADGGSHVISLSEGEILVDGEARGSYVEGGELERAWRSLLRSPELDTGDIREVLARWNPDVGSEAPIAAVLGETLTSLALTGAPATEVAAALPETATVAGPDGRQVAIAPGVLSLGELQRKFDQLRLSLEQLRSDIPDFGENFALVVHDSYVIPAEHVVPGNLALLDGELSLAGTVAGDVLVADGTLILEPPARIEGNVVQIGGELIDSGGHVDGELLSLLAGDLGQMIPEDVGRAVAGDLEAESRIRVRPTVHVRGPGFFGRIGHNIGHAVGGVAGVLVWLFGLGALGVVVVYFFRRRLEVVADTARLNLGRCVGVGLAGQLLFVPILLVLAVGIVTWLVIPFYLLAVAIALPAGYLAVAHAAGEAISLQRYGWIERFRFRRDNSYYYVISGLVFLLAPFAIGSALYLLGGVLGFVRGLTFFAAGVLTWAALTTGFGAVILTRGGSRTEFTRSAGLDDVFTSADGFQEGGSASA